MSLMEYTEVEKNNEAIRTMAVILSLPSSGTLKETSISVPWYSQDPIAEKMMHRILTGFGQTLTPLIQETLNSDPLLHGLRLQVGIKLFGGWIDEYNQIVKANSTDG